MTEHAPRFSIVTVVRDDRAGLERTHRCLCAQSWRDFEWIAVDGASTDGSAAYLAAQAGGLAWWRSAPDGGPYEAMNVGLAAARGDYLLFLNAGDTLAGPDTLAALAGAIAAAGQPDFVYGDALEDTADGRRLYKPARPHGRFWYGMFTHHQAMLYRRDSVRGLRFDLRYPVGADYAFTLAVLGRAGCVARLPFPVCAFAPGGLSQRDSAAGRRDQSRIRRDLLALPLPARAAISVAQWGAMAARRNFPTLFEYFRCRPTATTLMGGINGNLDPCAKLAHGNLGDEKLHPIPFMN